jgi:prepilin-type N-terminal cleavage/methylation domain-containing protein
MRRERGFSLIELLIVVAIIVIITAVAIPNLRTTRMQAQEASAQKSLNTLNTVCAMYQSSYHSYPHALSDLGPAVNGAPTKTAADLLNSVMAPPGGAAAVKDGYVFRYTPGAADESGDIPTYTITADPTTQNQTGVKRFFTDNSNTVHYTTDGSQATVLSPTLQ